MIAVLVVQCIRIPRLAVVGDLDGDWHCPADPSSRPFAFRGRFHAA